MKKNETHVAVSLEVHRQLKFLSFKEARTMRAIIGRLVENAYNEFKEIERLGDEKVNNRSLQRG